MLNLNFCDFIPLRIYTIFLLFPVNCYRKTRENDLKREGKADSVAKLGNASRDKAYNLNIATKVEFFAYIIYELKQAELRSFRYKYIRKKRYGFFVI